MTSNNQQKALAETMVVAAVETKATVVAAVTEADHKVAVKRWATIKESGMGNNGCGGGGNIGSSGGIGNGVQRHAAECNGCIWQGVWWQQWQRAQQAISRLAVKIHV
jgi:hypothetical protein